MDRDIYSGTIITGGTGFVGYWMKQTKPDGMILDCLNRSEYERLRWDDVGHNYIVHLAPTSPTRSLACAKRNGARLLYCSSGIVYHPENDTEYRRNKIHWEQECAGSGVDVVIARLFTFYGEHLSPDHAIVAFEEAAKEGRPLHVWGDGSCVRSYMSGAEMAKRLWAVLLKGESGESYDIGSTTPITILELAKTFSDNIIIMGGQDAMPVYLPVDTAKTKALLDTEHIF